MSCWWPLAGDLCEGILFDTRNTSDRKVNQPLLDQWLVRLVGKRHGQLGRLLRQRGQRIGVPACSKSSVIVRPSGCDC
jgi:hypothetical protein